VVCPPLRIRIFLSGFLSVRWAKGQVIADNPTAIRANQLVSAWSGPRDFVLRRGTLILIMGVAAPYRCRNVKRLRLITHITGWRAPNVQSIRESGDYSNRLTERLRPYTVSMGYSMVWSMAPSVRYIADRFYRGLTGKLQLMNAISLVGVISA